MHHGGEKRKKKMFAKLFVYWCLYMLIQQVLSNKKSFIWYKL